MYIGIFVVVKYYFNFFLYCIELYLYIYRENRFKEYKVKVF